MILKLYKLNERGSGTIKKFTLILLILSLILIIFNKKEPLTYEEKLNKLNSYSLEYIEKNLAEVNKLLKSIKKEEAKNPKLLKLNNIDDYFYTFEKIYREGELAFSLEPKNIVRLDKESAINAYISFVDYFKYDLEFKNEKSLENQFWCHFSYARSKQKWNLEPIREVVDELEMIREKCNP